MSKLIAIIPARGGSKRIPKKNILLFHEKPMIVWTIEAALKADLFDTVLVSTDSEEIADISMGYGAEVPFFREKGHDDMTPVSEAVTHALQQSMNHYNVSYDTVIQLMPNCPLRTSQDIVNSYQKFKNSNANFQISCFEYLWMNPWWATKISESGKAVPIFPEALNTRSQDLPKLYCPTGAIWIAKVKKLLDTKTFYSPDYKFCPISWKSGIDIDTYEDLEMAKHFFEINLKLNRSVATS